VPGFDKLPTDIDALVTRLQANRSGGGGSYDLSALKFADAKVNIQGATFKPGKMNVPGGWIDVGPNTRLSVAGSMQAATLRGHVELNAVDITQGGMALKGNKGSAELDVTWRDGVAITTLDKLNLDTEYAVQKRSNGDYMRFAQGRVANGRMQMEVPFDAEALKAGRPTRAELDVERFTGIVEGARLSAVVNGKRTQLEIGRAEVDGEVHIDPDRIEVKGTVKNADLLAKGLSTKAGAGAVDVESARMVGSGRVDFSTERGLEMEADVKAMDLKAKGRGAGQAVNRTHITGAGHVAWSSTQGLKLEGQLHVDAELSGEVQTKPLQRQAQGRQRVQRITVQRGAAQTGVQP
jgi:cytoskeletal protein CcmA (bactofilin family)